MQITVMLLLALVVGTMSTEDTVSPSSSAPMKGLKCIPLLSTYGEPVSYPSTVHRRYVPFPKQVNIKYDVLFSNVV